VVSLSVARAEPSASSGMRPRVMSVCLAGASPACQNLPGQGRGQSHIKYRSGVFNDFSMG